MLLRTRAALWFALGLLAGLTLWAAALGIQVQQHDAGLWTVRFQRGLDCGLDYNGPPFTDYKRTLWFFCGDGNTSHQVWPP